MLILNRAALFLKYNGKCAYCGKLLTNQNNGMHIDHIYPKRKGGLDCDSNYNPSCPSCNTSKSTYTIEEFRKRLIDDVARLRRDSSKFRILERFGVVKQAKDDVVFHFELIAMKDKWDKCI